jgi:hypothetical protein
MLSVPWQSACCSDCCGSDPAPCSSAHSARIPAKADPGRQSTHRKHNIFIRLISIGPVWHKQSKQAISGLQQIYSLFPVIKITGNSRSASHYWRPVQFRQSPPARLLATSVHKMMKHQLPRLDGVQSQPSHCGEILFSASNWKIRSRQVSLGCHTEFISALASVTGTRS